MKTTRREFLFKSAGTLVVISSSGLVSTILSSCSGSGPSGPDTSTTLSIIQGTVSNNEISVSLAASSPIAEKNTRALVEYSNASGAVLVEHNSDDTFRALSGVCTHQGCFVTYFDSTKNIFICPCHGSRFDLNGSVVQGPAPSKLAEYTTRVENNSLIITL